MIILLLLTLHLLLPTALTLGINCRGSFFCQYSPFTSDPNIPQIFLGLATHTSRFCKSPPFNCGPILDTDFYAPATHILCLPQSLSLLGGICAFTQGNVSPAGINGTLVKRKLEELEAHGCTLCGSVPLSEDNDPESEGIFTINHVARVDKCFGVCPPTHNQGVDGPMAVGLQRGSSSSSAAEA